MRVRRRFVMVGVIVFVCFIGLIIAGYWFDWAGFNGYTQVSTIRTLSGPTAGTVARTEVYQSGKTLWDWMQLLIIPFALAIIAIFFNRSERRNERRIASDNQQEAALQEYFKEMSELLLEKNLLKSDVQSEVRTIARVRTLTVLHRLDEGRKKNILQFLYESGLIDKSGSIVNLHGANLNRVRLSGVHLNETDMRGANLIEANLSGAYLGGVNLAGANLTRADLNVSKLNKGDCSKLSSTTVSKLRRISKAYMGAFTAGYMEATRERNLQGIDLSEAILNEADLRNTNLTQADLHNSFLLKVKLQNANLSNANLSDAILLEANLQNANLSGADLQNALLVGANLHKAKLIGANLREADLHRANLRLADLTKADLSGASLNYVDLRKTLVTDEQLAKAQSLKYAIMPDRSIHP